VNQRWLGGTLTNFQTIRGRINHMIDLQQKRDAGYFRVLPKKEGVKLRDTLNRLEKYFLGMREMNELPKALFVIDIGKEDICIAEARRMGIQIFAIVDTDCDPDKVTHSIPGNDDAVRSIRLIAGRMASAALEGAAQREAMLLAEQEEAALLEQARREELQLTEDDEVEMTEGSDPVTSELFGEEAEIPAMDSEGREIASLERTVVDEPAPSEPEATEPASSSSGS
jgi:small subunit ribosomal protein S2